MLANDPAAIAWLSFYAGLKFNFQNETDLKILRMFNILYNSKILATNAFKFSITTLFGASALLFNASAVSQDDTYGIGLDANHHHSYGQNIASEKRQNAQANTKALMNAMAAYQNATKSEKSNYLNKMISLAEERQQLLTELVKSSPASVASVAITTEEQQGMPKEVKKLLEQEQVLEGELEVFYEDYEDHSKSRLHHVLKTADGRVELHVSKNTDVNQLHSGLRVSAKGWSIDGNDNALFLDEDKNSIIISAQDSTSTSTTSSGTTTTSIDGTFGEQKTLVLLLNFRDKVQEPWTVQEAEELVFGTVNDFYRENSNDQTWLSGEVSGYLTLAVDEVCDINTIDNYAKQAATNNGIDTDSYDRLVYIFPEISNCGWTGMGTIGATQSRAWINGAFTVNTIGHELGHNFGLRHAQSLDCGVDIVGSNCTNFVYGDNIDIMGNGDGHFNGFNKESLGWLSSTEITSVTSDGSYLVEPYEMLHSGIAKVLKIPRGTDPETGKQLWYYIEYRQALGFDSFLEDKDGITGGVVMRLATESDMKSSQMLDMTPGSVYDDFSDAALSVGESYTDSVAGVTITTEWADSTGASVYVSFAEPTCTQSEPAISVTSNQSTAMVPGSLKSYTVSVTNNDSDSCSSSNFLIEAEAPAGWTTTEATIDLAPGASDTVTLDVTSDELATDGAYTITFNAFNSVDSSYYTSTTSSYLVETPVEACEVGTPLLSVVPNQSGELEPGSTISYTATVTNQDSVNCDSAVFNVALSVPNGWNGDNGTLTLAPGESKSVVLDATISSEALDGSYDVIISVEHTADSSLSVSEVLSVLIATSVEPNSAPIALDDTVTLATKDPVVINVLANDSDPEGDSLNIVSVTQGSKGSVQIISDGQILYTPAKNFKGSDSFTYSISDGNFTSTATVTIGLLSTDGGGKGKGNRK
ncbi:Ig-like domain-containing protein [Vibrio natriegens]|uniref:Ig-like domain-containing protein n=1 Tax=Vibrio natriegens TaxID=691 RepID=UPI001FB9909A|nr:Ig-like domain-containing protein [Vibrio natriegens]